MKKSARTFLAAFLALPMLLSCAAGNFAAAAKAAQTEPARVTRPALLKAFTKYEIDYKTKDWRKAEKTTFKYENAYPVQMKTYYYDAKNSSKTTFDYKFYKNNQPKSSKQYKNGSLEWDVSYNRDGTISEMSCSNAETKMNRFFQYANGAPYFTVVLHSNVYFDLDNPKTVDFTMEEVDSISVTTRSNGLLKKTVNTGLYANWNRDEEKVWRRFNGTYTANYDANGVVQNTSAIYRAGPSGNEWYFKATVKNGRITQVIQKAWSNGADGKGHWENVNKYVFQYTDINISKVRFAQMINDCLLTSSSTYYFYHWY